MESEQLAAQHCEYCLCEDNCDCGCENCCKKDSIPTKTEDFIDNSNAKRYTLANGTQVTKNFMSNNDRYVSLITLSKNVDGIGLTLNIFHDIDDKNKVYFTITSKEDGQINPTKVRFPISEVELFEVNETLPKAMTRTFKADDSF